MKYKLTIAYDGTRYCGWQNQPHKMSVQEEIERALATLLNQKTRIFGAGRTDAGVHALGQVAHVSTQELPDLKTFNDALPEDISVTEIIPVPEPFHAQYSSCNKIYHYHLWLKPPIPPHLRLYRHSPKEQISVPLLREGAQQFLGKQDFTTFANLGSSAKTSVRTLYRLDVVEQEGGVRLEFEGDGFLYKMVRNIMATLIEVASGKRDISEIKRLFEAKDRRAAGMVAPARGLFLIKVSY